MAEVACSASEAWGCDDLGGDGGGIADDGLDALDSTAGFGFVRFHFREPMAQIEPAGRMSLISNHQCSGLGFSECFVELLLPCRAVGLRGAGWTGTHSWLELVGFPRQYVIQ